MSKPISKVFLKEGEKPTNIGHKLGGKNEC
jgi:hypothetical protein